MAKKKTIVILAGGLGSRYKGLKQIDGILPNGSPILEYSIYDAISAGFSKIVIIINHSIPKSFIEKISLVLQEKNIEYHWVIQENKNFVKNPAFLENREKPWGTGHAILCCKDVVNEEFIAINADDFYGRKSYEIASQLIDNNEITAEKFALIPYPLENTLSQNGSVSRGLCHILNNKLQSVRELTQITPKGNKIFYEENGESFEIDAKSSVSMNFWIFHPAIFSHLEIFFDEFLAQNPNPKDEFQIPKVVDTLIKQQKIEVIASLCDEQWKGVTYPEDKAELVAFLTQLTNEQKYPTNLWKPII